MKIGLTIGVLLAALSRPAIAAEHTGRTLARVCMGDFERLCAKQIPVPTVEDFREGGLINQCLKEKLNQLSNACWYLITIEGR